MTVNPLQIRKLPWTPMETQSSTMTTTPRCQASFVLRLGKFYEKTGRLLHARPIVYFADRTVLLSCSVMVSLP